MINFMNECLSFLFFALTNNFLGAESPFTPAALRTHRTVSGEIEVENISLNSVVTFTGSSVNISKIFHHV